MKSDFLFITVNENERDAFLVKLENPAPKPFANGIVLNFGVFGKYDVAHYHSPEQGENAELKFYHAIEVTDPKFVILVGIACGAGEPQKIGEVLVSRRILDYNERKEDSCLFDNEKPEEPVSRLRGVEVSSGSHLSGLFYGLLAGWIKDNVKAYYDCIISSSFLVNHPKLKKEVFEAANTKLGKEAAIGYEMEGAPLYRACHDHKITEWIVVKAISDWGDGTKNKDEERQQKDQQGAAQNAVSLCHHVFLHENIFPAKKKAILNQ